MQGLLGCNKATLILGGLINQMMVVKGHKRLNLHSLYTNYFIDKMVKAQGMPMSLQGNALGISISTLYSKFCGHLYKCWPELKA